MITLDSNVVRLCEIYTTYYSTLSPEDQTTLFRLLFSYCNEYVVEYEILPYFSITLRLMSQENLNEIQHSIKRLLQAPDAPEKMEPIATEIKTLMAETSDDIRKKIKELCKDKSAILMAYLSGSDAGIRANLLERILVRMWYSILEEEHKSFYNELLSNGKEFSSWVIISMATEFIFTNNIIDIISSYSMEIPAANETTTDIDENAQEFLGIPKQYGWNCFDQAIDLTDRLNIDEKDRAKSAVAARTKLVDLTLANSSKLEYRKLLSGEIYRAATMTAIYHNLDVDHDHKVDDNDDEAKALAQHHQEITRCLNLITSLKAKNTDEAKSAVLCLRLFTRSKIDKDKSMLPEAMRREYLQSQVWRSQSTLQEYCEARTTYEQYLKEHYGKKGRFIWGKNFNGELGSTSMIDVVALLLDIQIIIYQRDSEGYKEILRTKNTGKQKLYLEDCSNNNFINLKENPVYRQAAADTTFAISFFRANRNLETKDENSIKTKENIIRSSIGKSSTLIKAFLP